MTDFAGIRWVFFDVGDTLLDETVAMNDWCAQVAAELARRGHSIRPADVAAAREQAYVEFAPDVLKRILEILNLTSEGSVYEVAKYQHALERPAPGAADVLKQLGQRFKLGIIANQSAGTAQRLCDHGWKDLFSVCISSTEEKLRKPDPRIFHLALDRAACPPHQAVMVGDRIDNDIRPAKEIGMATVRLRHGMSRNQQPSSPHDEPDATIDNLLDLPRLLR